MTGSPADTARALLEWYRAMGVDEAIAETPRDWFATSARLSQEQDKPRAVPKIAARPQPAKPKTIARAPIRAQPSDADTEEIRSIETLDALEQAVAQFEGCPLKRTAKNLCFARGNPKARLMLIGEAPGRDEDLQGQPFVGRAGKLLDRMLAAIDLGPDDVYITNVVYWRPPGNRTPTPQEVEACRPFLERQIELIRPEILVFLGGAAAKQMFGTTEGIMRLRGKWRDFQAGEHHCRAIATLHPAYLLRNPLGKRLAWRDLLAIRAALDTEAES